METLKKTYDSAKNLNSTVAANVRAYAAVLQITQVELAKKTNIDRASLSKRWTGAREWRLNELPVIADALGVPVNALLDNNAFLRPRQDSNLQPKDYTLAA